MAHRIIASVVFIATRSVGRAFAEAWRQASANSQHAKQAGQTGGSLAANNSSTAGLTLDEACKILNVRPPKGGKADMEMVTERFKKLFDSNEPKKGGSFYLQSKILRARERIDLEVRNAEEEAERERDLKEGLPKLYK